MTTDDRHWLDSGRIVVQQSAAPLTWPVRCAGCPARTVYRGVGLDRVHGQVELWRQGWRRRPNTGQDYCPTCAVAEGCT